MMKGKPLDKLQNIGKTVASRLHEIGITADKELRELGAAKAYQWLSRNNEGKHLPVCYYLYSLEGAIQDKHWDALSDAEKKQLRLAAGLPK